METALDEVTYELEKFKAKLTHQAMTTSEKAVIAEKIANMAHGGDRTSEQDDKLQIDSVSIDDAAKKMNVSKGSVHSVRNLKKNHPEAYEQLEKGNFKSIAAAVAFSASKNNKPCVYVFQLKDIITGKIIHPELCKIGRTDGDLNYRLNAQSSHFFETVLVGFIECENSSYLEAAAHFYFKNSKVPHIRGNEWFKVDAIDAVKSIKKIANFKI